MPIPSLVHTGDLSMSLLQFPPAPKAARPTSNDHLFVHNVRFWSMFSVIAMHCIEFAKIPGGVHSPLLQLIFVPFKFGTIGFFLISGFLLGERIDRCQPRQYLAQRIRRVFLPWLFWFSMLVAMFLVTNTAWMRAKAATGTPPLLLVAHWIRLGLVSTSFWFVPNLLCALAILLAFRRHIPSLRFGALLAGINVLYAANIYGLWLPSSHTEALFGFVFFLWLGAFAARHHARLTHILDRVSMPVLLIVLGAAGLLSFSESRLLTLLHDENPLNTLRASNQLFSIFFVLFFVKMRRTTFPRFVGVRTNTFGLYLTHGLFIIPMHIWMTSKLDPLPATSIWKTTTGQLGLCLVSFFVLYAGCLMLSQWLSTQPRLRWTIGSFPSSKPAIVMPTAEQRLPAKPVLVRMVRT